MNRSFIRLALAVVNVCVLLNMNMLNANDCCVDDFATNIPNPVQTAARAVLSNSSFMKEPPQTLGAFIHLGKTGGSTLSKNLRFGCHSFVRKPCPRKNITADQEKIISKTTTHYHVPDFENGKLQLRDAQNPYKCFVITIRDPLSRAISAFLYTHPDNVAMERSHASKKKNTRITAHTNTSKEHGLYPACFPNLEAHAQLLANFTDYTHVEKEHLNNTKDCANLAKGTLHHAAFKGMVHNHYDLRHIFAPLTNVTQRAILAMRTEFIKEDWVSSHGWLGEEVEFASKTLRNSTAIEYPVKKEISEQGKKNMCLALKDEYRICLRILVLAKNLSKETVQKSLEIARTNCPWLDLMLPDANTPEKFVSDGNGLKWQF